MARCPACRQVVDGDECSTCGAPLTEAGRQRKAAARAHNAVSAIQNFGATIQDDDMSAEDMAEIQRVFAAADVAQPAPRVADVPASSVAPLVVTVPPKPDGA